MKEEKDINLENNVVEDNNATLDVTSEQLEDENTVHKYKVVQEDGTEKIVEMTVREFKLRAGQAYYNEMHKQLAYRKQLMNHYAKQYGYSNLVNIGKMKDSGVDFDKVREEIANKTSKLSSSSRKVFTELSSSEFNEICNLFSPESAKKLANNLYKTDGVDMMERICRVKESGDVVDLGQTETTSLTDLSSAD